MKKIEGLIFNKILRYLLAAIIILFSLNGFFSFLPMPEPPKAASAFLNALAETGYMFPLLYGVEILVGIMLLFKKFTPLALLLFLPIAVNILFYHLFLDPAGGGPGYFTVLLTILLIVYNKRDIQKLIISKS